MGSSKQTTTQNSQQYLPGWENSDYQRLMGSTMGSVYGANGQPNSNPAQQTVAPLTSNSTGWFQNAQNSNQIGDNLIANNAFNGYTPNVNASTASNSFNGYTPNVQNAFSSNTPQAANKLDGWNSNIKAQDVGTSQWDNSTAQQYMNPYIQQVLKAQGSLANQQHQQDLATEDRSAAASGALGGDRNAVNRNQLTNDFDLQQQNLQAQALQNAYGTAQTAFTNDANRNLQAGISNSQLGLAADTKNADLNYQSLANQNSLNLGNAQLLYNALNSQNQTNSENAQMQYGALGQTNQLNLANAGYQNQATQLGAQLGFGAASGTNAVNAQAASDYLNALTQQQQAAKASQNYAQYGNDTSYQNAMNNYLFPQQQLQWGSSMLNSMPQQWSSDSQSSTISSPSAFSQIMGGLMGAASMYGGMKSNGVFGDS